MKKKVLVSEKE